MQKSKITNVPLSALAQNKEFMSKVQGKEKIRILAWMACPFVITGFGIVVKEIFTKLFRMYPGKYEVNTVSINFHGDFCEESIITGGEQNGRFRQWPAAIPMPGGGMNLYGQPKFLQLLSDYSSDFDVIFLFEDPFWVGGGFPGSGDQKFVDSIRGILARKGMAHVPIVSYFPIDGIPKQSWIENIAKADFPVACLPFAAEACYRAFPPIQQKLQIVGYGVNDKEFFPLPKDEVRSFKRAMFGDEFADQFMILNVNRNQLRKLVPSNMLVFKKFKEMVPKSFMFFNMKPEDVGWNLFETCNALGLVVGRDVMFPPDFQVPKGLSIETLNKVFNAADLLTSTAVGGGWELALTQAFATKTSVLMPANTSHIDLCGPQHSEKDIRGLLYKSGSCLAQLTVYPSDNEVIRPLPDLDDMLQKMKFLYDNPGFCRKMEENAFKWTQQNLSWERNVVPAFDRIFSEAKQLKQSRILQASSQNVSRQPL